MLLGILGVDIVATGLSYITVPIYFQIIRMLIYHCVMQNHNHQIKMFYQDLFHKRGAPQKQLPTLKRNKR